MSNKFDLFIRIAPFILALILTVFIVSAFKFLPQKLPLFYSLSWGEEQLATHPQFLILPATIILISLVNPIISSQLHTSQSFFKHILLFSSLTISIILIIAFIKIVINFI